jgi:hypothetical protein
VEKIGWLEAKGGEGVPGTIYYDTRSGKLLKNHIWQWASPSVLDLKCLRGELAKEPKSEWLHECPIDKRHEAGIKTTEIRIDLLGEPLLGDLVHEYDVGPYIITEPFLRRLKESKLTGFGSSPIVEVVVNQTAFKTPKLFYLEIIGKGGFCRRLKVKGAANACPHCGKEPVVCPGCGRIQRQCLACGKNTLFLPGAPWADSDEKGFRFEGYPDIDIVQAKEWDGSDWFDSGGMTFISSRAKDWLERTHTYPIEIKPALLDVEGVEEKFKGK